MTDQTTETRVAEIEKRAEKTTNRYASLRAIFDDSLRGPDAERAFKTLDAFLYDNQRALIDHAREDIPWLLSKLRAAWKREAALRAAMKIASEWAERVSLGTDATPRIVGAMALIQAATKEANNE